MDEKVGTCLCGAVTVTAEPFPSMQACHCRSCQTWGGGPFMSVPCKSAKFDGAVTRYASSDHAERGFCPACGTHLFFYAKGPGVYAIPFGLFRDGEDLPFKAQIYVDERPAQYTFANETRTMTGAEFEAKFR